MRLYAAIIIELKEELPGNKSFIVDIIAMLHLGSELEITLSSEPDRNIMQRRKKINHCIRTFYFFLVSFVKNLDSRTSSQCVERAGLEVHRQSIYQLGCIH